MPNPNILRRIKSILTGLIIGLSLTTMPLTLTSCGHNKKTKELSIEVKNNQIDTSKIASTIFNGNVFAKNFSTTSNSLILNNTDDFDDFKQVDAANFTVKLKSGKGVGTYNLSIKDKISNITSKSVEIRVVEYTPTKFIDAKVDDVWTSCYLLLPINQYWQHDPLSETGIQEIKLITFAETNTFFEFISDNRDTQKNDSFNIFICNVQTKICQANNTDHQGKSSYMEAFKKQSNVSVIAYLGDQYYQYWIGNTYNYKIVNKDFTSDHINDKTFYEDFLQYVLVSEISYSKHII